MSKIIDRNLICDYINYAGHSKQDLCNLINRWKRLLIERYGAKRGQILGIAIFEVNPNHIALLFAAAEIGMKILVMSKIVSEETMASSKIALLGPTDVTVVQKDSHFVTDLSMKVFNTYSRNVCFETDIEEITDDSDIETEEVFPQDPIFLSSTSGSTGNSKPVYLTHEFVMKVVPCEWNIQGYTKETTVMHNVNMHHITAAVVDIFPTLAIVEEHHYGLIYHGQEEEFVRDYLVGRKIKRMLAQNKWQMDRLIPYIRKYKEKFTHKIQFFTSGFVIPPDLYDVCKELPIEIVSAYGSSELGGVAFNRINEKSIYVAGYAGKISDYFTIEIRDGISYASSEVFGFDNVMIQDSLEIVGEDVYYRGRLDQTILQDSSLRKALDDQCDYSYLKSINSGEEYIVIWNISRENFDEQVMTDIMRSCKNVAFLNKEDFVVDTKVDNAQLLAYLDTTLNN